MDKEVKAASADRAKANREKSSVSKIVNIICIVVCVILLPILVFNCVLIVKGLINPDDVPRIGKSAPLIVLTESMDPTIKAGDLIICKQVGVDEIKVGDVISFYDPSPYANSSSIVTHRVIEIEVDPWTGEIFFWTQGDNNNKADGFAVPQDNLVGLWTGTRIGLIGYVVMFMQSTWGLIICIALPIAAIVVYEVLRRKKQDNDKQKDIDSLKAELAALKAERTEGVEQAAEQESSDQADQGKAFGG